MILKGGYVMVDLKGLNLAETEEQTIDGAFDTLSSAINDGCMIIVYNCEDDGDMTSPFPVRAEFTDDDEITLYFEASQAVVADDDGITVSSLIPEPEPPTP